MLSVKAVTTYDDFLRMRTIWDSLLSKSGLENPFLTHDWFRIAYDHFDKHHDLFILVVQSDQEVIAIAPFILSREKFWGLPIKKIRFLNNVHTPSQEFILTERQADAVAAILDFLQSNHQLWDVFELKEIRENSNTLFLLENLCEERNIYHPRFLVSTNWEASTDISLEEALAKLSANAKRKYKRRHRHLKNLGHLSFEMFTDFDTIEKNLHTFFAFYEQSWKGKERNSDFYYDIARAFCQKNNAILFSLFLNQQPIAYLFTVRAGKKLFGRKTTFDPSFYAYSPGRFLMDEIYSYCIQKDDIGSIDFGRGNETYKQDYGGIPLNQVCLLGAHKKTIVSFIFFLRYRIVLYFKRTKYFIAIQKSIQNGISQLKKLPMIVKTKLFSKHHSAEVYLKTMNGTYTQPEEKSWQIKFAGMEDLDDLVIAMRAKRFSDVRERLGNEKCVLITRNNKIEHYFWLSDNRAEYSFLRFHNDGWIITDYNSSFLQADEQLALKIMNALCHILTSIKCRQIFLSFSPPDSDQKAFFEWLGFKKYEGAN